MERYDCVGFGADLNSMRCKDLRKQKNSHKIVVGDPQKRSKTYGVQQNDFGSSWNNTNRLESHLQTNDQNFCQ